MTNLKLIAANPTDSKYIASLLQYLPTVPELVPDAAQIEKEILLDKVLYYLVRLENDSVVGCCGFRDITNHLAETTRTVIEKQYRGFGFGGQTSVLIEEEIKKLGYGKVRCQVYDTNATMLAIKLKQGYTVEGFHRDNDAPGIHEYTLGKLI